ncbi:MAG: T9SS C-terminal target domain-containing protein [Firmicutes bacterium]|nr:T9SS C-terminal target domain-containing protein [Bacillota bacterium]
MLRRAGVLFSLLSVILLTLTFSVISGCGEAGNPESFKWQRSLGGTDEDNSGAVVLQTTGGDFVIAGRTFSNDGDVTGNRGSSDAWIVKLDEAGHLLWQKCHGGSGEDGMLSVLETGDGGYITGGLTSSNDGEVSGLHGSTDFWVVKLNSNGGLSWQKCLGGSSADTLFDIRPVPDGGYVVAGFTFSTDDDAAGNHGMMDGWVAKLDSDGNIVSRRCVGGSDMDMLLSIQMTSDGGYVAVGSTSSRDGDITELHGGTDALIAKFDSSGDLVWQKCIGGTKNDYATTIQPTKDGGFILQGETESNDGDVSGNHGDTDIWVVKFDSRWNMEWQKCLGGSLHDSSGGIVETIDGGYALSGYVCSTDGDISDHHGIFENSDVWLAKLDSSGNLLWQSCLGGSLNDVGKAICRTSDGGFIISGDSKSTDDDVTGHHGDIKGNDIWAVKVDPYGKL